jgi:glutathionyl-hydroquinone reductase
MSTFTAGVAPDVAAGLYEKDFEKWYGHIEKRIQENGSTGFAVGDDLTNADICIWRIVDCSIEWQPVPGF